MRFPPTGTKLRVHDAEARELYLRHGFVDVTPKPAPRKRTTRKAKTDK